QQAPREGVTRAARRPAARRAREEPPTRRQARNPSSAATSPIRPPATTSWTWWTWATTREAAISAPTASRKRPAAGRWRSTTNDVIAATAVWSDGKPLSGGWENQGWIDGFCTKGRGSVCSAPATLTRIATLTRPTTISTAIATFSGRGTISQTTTASTATTYRPSSAMKVTSERTRPWSGPYLTA